MHFFSTYYNNAPISLLSFKEEVFAVNKILNSVNLEHFFTEKNIKTIVCSNQVNEFPKINERLREINKNLAIGEYYVGHFETYSARRNRQIVNKIPIIRGVYFFLTFIFHRILPRLKGINFIYFAITKGKNRLLSKAEVLGRLIYNGFEIVQIENINEINYFKVRKASEPKRQSTSYGFIFKMPRVGKNGKLFSVYKLRTMHPYSEYLQDYIVKEHGLGAKGKVDRDFRVTPWGKWMRKYWIDEIPQILNVCMGQMKLVGVRPVSEGYFKNLPEDLQQKRIKYKPGCIPPYVAMNRKSNLRSVLSSEKVYLKLKEKNPYFTDIKFFFYALINIIFKGKRSS